MSRGEIVKIVFVTPGFHPILGGAEVFTYEIAKRLARDGNDVHVITRKYTKQHQIELGLIPQPLDETEILENIMIHRTRYLNTRDIRLATFVPPAFKKLMQISKQERLDILHGIMIFPAGIICSMAQKLLKQPFILTLQGFLIDVFRANQTILDLYGGVLRPIVKFSLRSTQMIHAVSKPLAFEAVKRVIDVPICVIPNGVDITRFIPIKRNPSAPLTIGTVSRLVAKNNLSTLIRAFTIVLERNPEARLKIVGAGPEFPKLSQLVHHLGVANQVDFLGSIPHQRVHKYMQRFDVFVRPSLTEGFGIVFIEAMASGCVTIGPNIPVVSNILKDGYDGFLVDPRSPEAIADLINEIAENRKTIENVSLHARKKVVSCYSWDSVYLRIKKKYNEIWSSLYT